MIEKRKRFKVLYPDKYFADKEDLSSMNEYLRSIDFLTSAESVISVEIPGAGNMNYVLRVRTSERSFILKQSRPWVEKYPSIDAPIERINIEAAYFTALQEDEFLHSHSPEIYHVDASNFILLMEDLGVVDDLTHLYNSEVVIDTEDITALANYLSALHDLEVVDFPGNLGMRKLNHEHIFNYPYIMDNGFDLDEVQEGLGKLAVNESTHPQIINAISQAGEQYLAADGQTLLHGDFYPGSWMKSNKSFFVIDAEFGFLGPREFDLGVFIAHMKMADQHDSLVKSFLQKYEAKNSFDRKLAYRFAGIEILRRLLGVAQLPLQISLEQKGKLIDTAISWIEDK